MPVLPISEQNPSHIVRPCWAIWRFSTICFHKKGEIFNTKKQFSIFFNQPRWAQAPTQLSARNKKGGSLSLKPTDGIVYICLHTVYITGPQQCLSSNHLHFHLQSNKSATSRACRTPSDVMGQSSVWGTWQIKAIQNRLYELKMPKKNNCYVFHPPIFRSNTKWECVWDVWESFSKSLQRKRVASQYSLHNLPFFFVGFLFFPSFLLQNPSFIGMLASILRLEPGGVPHRIFPFPVPHQCDRRPEHPRARLLRKRRRQGGAHGALPLAHLRVWLRVVSPGVKTTPTTPRGGYMGTPK